MVSETALRTDHYELTMVQAARHSGVADQPATFELFARRLGTGRRFGVVAGTGRIPDAIAAFRFGEAELAFLERKGIVDAPTIAWLADYRFDGDIHGYAEGEAFFPGSPVLRVDATFATGVVLETILLSILNHDSAVATAAARMAIAAHDGGARLMDMGGRRTDDGAAVDAARAAFVGGFHATSNLEAGRRFGIPTLGTAAHAFVLAHRTEHDAFVAQLESLGAATTLLVDTYDTEAGIRTAVAAARELGLEGPGGIRLDSGDMAAEARRARALLDELGATATRIVVSSDLDEFEIERFEQAPAGRAPIDAYGIGTRLVTGSGVPTAGFVYKLVQIDGRPVEKHSVGKATHGGVKQAYRVLDDRGVAVTEAVVTGDFRPVQARPLMIPVVQRGEAAAMPTLGAARAHCADAIAELPAPARRLDPGEPAIPTEHMHKPNGKKEATT
jgi:nicotinate phosphoribosyltransferase